MPTQDIAETEFTRTLQSQGHVASNMHNGLVIVALIRTRDLFVTRIKFISILSITRLCVVHINQ